MIWAQGYETVFLSEAIEIFGSLVHGCSIVGVTGENERKNIYMNGGAIPFIPLDRLNAQMADYIIVSETKMQYIEVLKKLQQKGFSADVIIRDVTICIPGFTFEKYYTLRASRLSIISLNCFGGVVCNLFGMEFLSPFINMFLSEEDFLSMLEQDPRRSLTGPLKLVRTVHEENLDIMYPVYDLNGIELNMNHYADFKEAKSKWYERIQRINWYNLLIVMYTEDEEVLKRFDRLPFGKKVCFVPFESDLPSAFSFDRNKLGIDLPTWDVADRIANGSILVYDLWDMLLYGKKTSIENRVRRLY